jgi:four helix bundle protein
MFNFEKLEVYQKAVEFAYLIMVITSKWPREYQFSPADQLRRASLSISLNIAEGSSRTRKDFQRFLNIARGSSYECIPLIQLAYKLKLISSNDKEIWYNNVVSLAKMTSKLKTSLS